mmetsp:Transcript_19444/g.44290  ORF Transcript_19444/g.44290 Transcript_19444/m.44290 type:complete len:160 (-) Transcript_19444:407-886(-)
MKFRKGIDVRRSSSIGSSPQRRLLFRDCSKTVVPKSFPPEKKRNAPHSEVAMAVAAKDWIDQKQFSATIPSYKELIQFGLGPDDFATTSHQHEVALRIAQNSTNEKRLQATQAIRYARRLMRRESEEILLARSVAKRRDAEGFILPNGSVYGYETGYFV